ncbi:MAG: CARDB domain-containing protein [Phycisphaerales bacterium]
MLACESNQPAKTGYTYDGMWIPEPTDRAPEPAPAPEPARPAQVARPAPAPAPMPAGPCNYSPMVPPGWGVSQLAFPTGDVRSSALLVHEMMPAAVRAGQTFTPEIHVTNITGGTLQNVMLQTSSFRNFDVSAANPTGTKTADGWSWPIGDLGPCRTYVIKLTGTAKEVGTAGNCLTVSYANALCAMTQVVMPALAIDKTITPQSILNCDPIAMTVTVRNSGSGDATNVVIKDALPSGLTTTDGKSSVEIPVGTLAAGQSKPFTVQLRATKTGKFENTAMASADGNLTAKSQTVSTTVTQPVLTITCKSPERVAVNRDVTYAFTVKNTGDAACDNTTVTASLAAGVTNVRMSDGGANGVWNLGALAPGAERTVSVTFRPGASVGGSVQVAATAACRCAAPATTNCTTSVFGLPDIGTLVTDDNVDIVLVGDNQTYRVEIKNQGQINLTNVKMVVTLPEGLDFVSSPTATVSGRAVTFNFGTIAPGRVVGGTFIAKATTPGEKLLVGETTCTEIKTPVRDDELTNFVGR